MLIQSNLWLAAQELASIQMKYAESGRTLSEATLCGAKVFVEWQHYPANDLVDEVSGYEFYYHAHSADEMVDDEHGHFHLFKRCGHDFHHLQHHDGVYRLLRLPVVCASHLQRHQG